MLSSLAWLPRLELCPRARGNSIHRTLSRCWISSLSSSYSAALLDRSLSDIYITDVCNTAEALPLVAFGFIELFDYMILMLVLVVFINNVLTEHVSAFGL
jgi:uncharacterized membrane protein